MTATTAPASTPDRTAIAPAHLVGGIGGLIFAATVIAQNGIRGLTAPAGGATASSVAHFYATHRPATLALAALFPLGAAGLAGFAGALGSRLAGTATRAAALAGLLGAAAIFATYTMVIATDVSLAGYVHLGGTDASVITALWVTHNAVFGVLLVAIAVALAGLSAAASAARLVAPAGQILGALGAVALAATGAATPAVIDGSPVLALGLAGFLIWIAFVITAAVALMRRPVRRAAGHSADPARRQAP
jgi:hypothetical protein